MAPVARYASPPQQLGRLMVQARRDGLTFETFWERAIRPDLPLVMTNHPQPPYGAVRWPTDRTDRLAWQDAIGETVEGWQRAYEREAPLRSEVAVSRLFSLLADADGPMLVHAA